MRNAGNLVPHAKLYDTETVSTEPAALELGCIVNGIKNVIICGHSDCKVGQSALCGIGVSQRCQERPLWDRGVSEVPGAPSVWDKGVSGFGTGAPSVWDRGSLKSEVPGAPSVCDRDAFRLLLWAGARCVWMVPSPGGCVHCTSSR